MKKNKIENKQNHELANKPYKTEKGGTDIRKDYIRELDLVNSTFKDSGEDFAIVFKNIAKNERQKSPLIRLWLSKQKLDEVKYKNFDSQFPGVIQKGYFSEHLSAAYFLEKCHKNNNIFFDNFPVASLRHFFHKLKNLSDSDWKIIVNKMQVELESEAILTQKIVNKAYRKLFPKTSKSEKEILSNIVEQIKDLGNKAKDKSIRSLCQRLGNIVSASRTECSLENSQSQNTEDSRQRSLFDIDGFGTDLKEGK